MLSNTKGKSNERKITLVVSEKGRYHFRGRPKRPREIRPSSFVNDEPSNEGASTFPNKH